MASIVQRALRPRGLAALQRSSSSLCSSLPRSISARTASSGRSKSSKSAAISTAGASSWLTAAAATATAAAAAAVFVRRGEVECSSADQEELRQLQRLREALEYLRPGEKEMRERWVKEEEGWYRLPPRAWPTRQPKADDIPALREELLAKRCPSVPSKGMAEGCFPLTFDLATALVFTATDGPGGLKLYRALAAAGDLEALVAVGVILIEGLVGPRNHEEGVQCLRTAADAGSAQAQFELGTLLYAGGADLEEDEEGAFKLFQQAAAQKHRDGMFMVADCLLEGVGVKRDLAAAVPLLHASAVLGHRGARQHLRQLLDGKWMGFEGASGPAKITM